MLERDKNWREYYKYFINTKSTFTMQLLQAAISNNCNAVTSISADTEGPHDAASRTINYCTVHRAGWQSVINRRWSLVNIESTLSAHHRQQQSAPSFVYIALADSLCAVVKFSKTRVSCKVQEKSILISEDIRMSIKHSIDYVEGNHLYETCSICASILTQYWRLDTHTDRHTMTTTYTSLA